MILMPVKCPVGDRTDVVSYGTQPNGAPRSRWTHAAGGRQFLLWPYAQKGRWPEVEKQRLDLAVKGSVAFGRRRGG